MSKLRSCPLFAAIALAAASAAAPHAASAASVQGQATAIIKSGISVRAASDPAAAPIVTADRLDWPPPRNVVRPCDPGAPASQAQCRFVLLELQ